MRAVARHSTPPLLLLLLLLLEQPWQGDELLAWEARGGGAGSKVSAGVAVTSCLAWCRSSWLCLILSSPPPGPPRVSQDPDSTEALTFQLAHPLCLVTEVALRPFRAWFQWVSRGVYTLAVGGG